MPGVKSVTVMVMVGAGSRYESKKINGLSHFLEHMAFKGTEKRPSSLAISSTIDAIGGEFNAFTSKDHTGFYIKAAADHVGLLVDVLADMLLHSLFKTEEIEREKGVIIEEINMYRDMPIRHIGDIYEELLYGDHPLGWNIAGLPEIIRTITREDFMTYMKGLYRPNNTVVVIAGGIAGQEAAMKSLVQTHLGAWEKADIWPWEKNSMSQTKPRVRVDFKDTEQAHLAIGVPAYPLGDEREYAISVLSAILGGGMSSRLFIQVRERRGLAYYVNSSIEHYLDRGGFTSQAGVDVKRIDDAISVIVAEYFGLAEGKFPITDEELKKGKEYLKGRLTLELEDSRAVGGLYSTQEILLREVKTPEEIIAKTEAVTLEDIMKIARDIFKKDQLNLAIIGPYKEPERFEKLLE
jgi:predicted Zn-dependent peptidase